MAVAMAMRMAVAVGGRGGVRFIVHPAFYQSGRDGKRQNVTLLQNQNYFLFFNRMMFV
jgi:hypothetical protein